MQNTVALMQNASVDKDVNASSEIDRSNSTGSPSFSKDRSKKQKMNPRRGSLKMKYDKTHTNAVNPNAQKSLRVLNKQYDEEKTRFTKAKKKLDRRFERKFNKFREYDLLTCIIAILGLAMAIVDWEYTKLTTAKIIADRPELCPQDQDL